MNALPRVLIKDDLNQIALFCTKSLKIKQKEVISLSFATLEDMKHLNKATRGIDKPTDVLSFESEMPIKTKQEMVVKGDIVLCSEYAKKEAERRSLSLKEELIRLIVHGTLHLHGYDHATESEELEMFALQESLVEKTLSSSRA
jgi:probable rRNA maturation factor